MRICYLNNDISDKTGAGRFYNALIRAFKKTAPDFQYKVLTHDDGLPKKFWQFPFYFFRIRQAFKNYDIVHALDGWPYGVIAVLASRRLKKRVIITAIGTGAVKPLYNWWKRPIMKWAYRKADRVVAVSQNTRNKILKFLPDLDVTIINHGVSYENFQFPMPTGRQAISNFQLNSKFQNLKPYILSVGALKKRKGYEYSIAAFVEISKKFPDLKYMIVGKGPEYKNLQFTISNFQLQNRVVFLENLSEEELITLYKNAEVFILMPQDIEKDIEGFGLVFLEAAATGLPVIATKETSAEDAVRDGQNGILVSPCDFEAAATAMEKILSDKKIRENMSQESIKFAKEMSWEKAARAYQEVYRRIL